MMVNKAKKPNVLTKALSLLPLQENPAWQLNRIEADQPCVLDNSGIYAAIHYIAGGIIRIDLMDNDNNPVQSFSGKADNVRKVFCDYLDQNRYALSYQHISYIGQEIAKAAIQKHDYIQD